MSDGAEYWHKEALRLETDLAAANERTAELSRCLKSAGIENEETQNKVDELRALIVEKDAALAPWSILGGIIEARFADDWPLWDWVGDSLLDQPELSVGDCRRAKAAWERKETT